VYSLTMELSLNLSLALQDVLGRNSLLHIVESNYNYKYFYLYSFYRLFEINGTETQHAKIWNMYLGRLRDRRDKYIILISRPLRYREGYEKMTQGERI
jgi:hypothetical protein